VQRQQNEGVKLIGIEVSGQLWAELS
jgi:hypothetical protein